MAGVLALLFGGISVVVFQNPSGSWRLNWDLSEDVPYEETGFAAPPELLLPLERLLLSVTETSVTFYDIDGTKRKYLLSGEKEQSSFRGFDVDTRARWNGRTLRLQVSPQPGLVVVENYSVDRNTSHLVLSITVLQAGRRTGPGIRYVYDSVFAR
jgi:hypothetical protein